MINSRLVPVVVAFGLGLGVVARADGIPEPSLILYGVISDTSSGGSRVSFGSLTWTFRPVGGGAVVVATGVLTNINDQFSYVLRVPCETPLPAIPASTNTLQLASSPTLYDRSQVTVQGVAASFAIPSLTNLTLTSTDRGKIERIDLTVNLNLGEVLPDAWQMQYFGHLNVPPDDDPDHDGLTNWQEYRAGTDPTDPQSRFVILRVTSSASGSSVQWSSVQGKFYTVQRSPDLLNGFNDLQVHIPATAPLNLFQDSTAGAGTGHNFYRIRVE
ncbi:MAG TPA: hypothetical protein VL361_20130 [Candidatus Limnocylindrales bacterium]|jgi:hypothetical protein|nr:hypothetical protein [Candidatus Limnocylindrales bacterium]